MCIRVFSPNIRLVSGNNKSRNSIPNATFWKGLQMFLVAISKLGNFWRLVEGTTEFREGRDLIRVYYHRIHLPGQPFSPGVLISVVWRLLGIPGDLQVLPRKNIKILIAQSPTLG